MLGDTDKRCPPAPLEYGDQDAEAYIVAIDRKTGEEKWRIDRPNRVRSYCAPLIVEAGGKTQMVLAGSLGISSYDPDTSKLIWSMKGFCSANGRIRCCVPASACAEH